MGWEHFFAWWLGLGTLTGIYLALEQHLLSNRLIFIIKIIAYLLGIIWTFLYFIVVSDFFLQSMILIEDFLVKTPAIYYFLSAIIVLLVMIFIRLNANKKRED